MVPARFIHRERRTPYAAMRSLLDVFRAPYAHHGPHHRHVFGDCAETPQKSAVVVPRRYHHCWAPNLVAGIG